MDYLIELRSRKKAVAEIVERYKKIGNPIPKEIVDNAGRIAFFPAQLASASSMDMQFYGLATKHSLVPVWDEYLDDVFASINGRKLALIRPFDRFGNRVKLVNPQKCEGKKLSEIVLDDGQSLIDYHHNKWDEVFSGKKALKVETSAWLNGFGDAKDYYYHVMIIYTFFGVKFWPSNISALYRDGEKESLVNGVMEPARKRVFEEFSYKPLEVYFELVPTLV